MNLPARIITSPTALGAAVSIVSAILSQTEPGRTKMIRRLLRQREPVTTFVMAEHLPDGSIRSAQTGERGDIAQVRCFLAETCTIAFIGHGTPASTLYEAYASWGACRRLPVLSTTMFGRIASLIVSKHRARQGVRYHVCLDESRTRKTRTLHG